MQNYNPLELAQREMKEFDLSMHEHVQAMKCQDCEEQLLKGIKALGWIERAEECVIQAENDCLVDFSLEVHEIIELLYKDWFTKCEPVLATAISHQDAGFDVAYLTEFSECLIRAKEWLRVQNEIREHSMSHEELMACASKCK